MDSGFYVFDLEGDALYKTGGRCKGDLEHVWCVVVHDLQEGHAWHCDIRTGFARVVEAFSNAKLIVGHNIIDFDLYVLRDKLGVRIPQNCTVVDTLVWSRALYPDRRRYDGKGHGLEAWGERFGIEKPPIEDWSSYDPEKLHRCYEDVKINVRVFESLKAEAGMYPSGKFLALEQEVSKIISEQTKRGQHLDQELCHWLVEGLNEWLSEVDSKLRKFITKRVVPGAAKGAVWKADGRLRADVLKWFHHHMLSPGHFSFGTEPDEEGNLFCLVTFEEVNLNSDKQLLPILQSMGWEPLTWTPKGSPQITEESLAVWVQGQPEREDIKLLVKRRVIIHRLGMVEGWLRDVDEDGRIRGEVNPQGAVTLRMTHQKVVNVPKYKKDEPLSEFYRMCFTSTPAKVEPWTYERTDPRTGEKELITVTDRLPQIGCDAKGLENRMLAARMNDPELTDVICDPEKDFHTHMWQTVPEWFDTRGEFKNWEYAFFYGAADLKLGTMASRLVELTEEEARERGWRYIEKGKSAGLWKQGEGKAVPWRGVLATVTGEIIRAKVMKSLPSLDKLNETVRDVCRQGYLVGRDGRRLIMRLGYDHQVETHKALNVLLQGDGALVMKVAQVLAHKELLRQGIVHWFLQTVHDEFQIEVLDPARRHEAAEILIWSIRQAGVILELPCELDGDAQIGVNWGETH